MKGGAETREEDKVAAGMKKYAAKKKIPNGRIEAPKLGYHQMGCKNVVLKL